MWLNLILVSDLVNSIHLKGYKCWQQFAVLRWIFYSESIELTTIAATISMHLNTHFYIKTYKRIPVKNFPRVSEIFTSCVLSFLSGQGPSIKERETLE